MTTITKGPLAGLELTKAALLDRYGLIQDEATGAINRSDDCSVDAGSPAGEFDARIRQLLNESLWYAADALQQNAAGAYGAFRDRHLDDSRDYCNAINDQITWIFSTMIDTDGVGVTERVIALLNLTRDNIESGNTGEVDGDYPPAFQYGYADHFTPISAIARMNDDSWTDVTGG